jgi:hypothetical protein
MSLTTQSYYWAILLDTSSINFSISGFFRTNSFSVLNHTGFPNFKCPCSGSCISIAQSLLVLLSQKPLGDVASININPVHYITSRAASGSTAVFFFFFFNFSKKVGSTPFEARLFLRGDLGQEIYFCVFILM